MPDIEQRVSEAFQALQVLHQLQQCPVCRKEVMDNGALLVGDRGMTDEQIVWVTEHLSELHKGH